MHVARTLLGASSAAQVMAVARLLPTGAWAVAVRAPAGPAQGRPVRAGLPAAELNAPARGARQGWAGLVREAAVLEGWVSAARAWLAAVAQVLRVGQARAAGGPVS